MTVSLADVVTAHASRYLQQLCKHWSHKFSVSFDERQGKVPSARMPPWCSAPMATS